MRIIINPCNDIHFSEHSDKLKAQDGVWFQTNYAKHASFTCLNRELLRQFANQNMWEVVELPDFPTTAAYKLETKKTTYS